MTVSTIFLQADKPYGGGAFRIDGTKFMTLKIADPEIKFKPVRERRNPEKAEPTEAWMNSPAELLNRTTVNLLRGALDGVPTRLFQQPGQTAAWWYSRDWNTIYVSTGWTNYKAGQLGEGNGVQTTALWESRNGGKTWDRLAWPEMSRISRLLFMDPQHGYAIGEGPHIWRTEDGGRFWHEISLPPQPTDGSLPQALDRVDLSSKGVLRLALYADEIERTRASTSIFRLDWGTDHFQQEATLRGQTVVGLRSAPSDTGGERVYALSELGVVPHLAHEAHDALKTGAISTWTAERPSDVQQLHAFDSRFALDGMSVGKNGVLIVFATGARSDNAPHDFTFVSSDSGRSWEKHDDGISQGGYFDADTNTLYRLYGYTLKKRTF